LIFKKAGGFTNYYYRPFYKFFKTLGLTKS